MRVSIGLMMLVFFSIVLYAGDEIQTDWSGGPYPGPVTFWNDFFDETFGINWYDSPGELTLGVPEYLIDGSFDGAECVVAADVDDDGDMDVVGCGMSANEIVWWENDDGSGTSWTEHVVDGSISSPICIYAEDVDNDNDLDILCAAYYSGIYWYENMNGSGTSWTKRTIDSSFHNGAWSVYSIDIDGDNDLDAVGAAISLNTIAWFENIDGAGTSWVTHQIDTSFGGTRSTFAADIDGDNDIDVIGAATQTSDIAWWENVDGSGTSWSKHNVDTNFPGAAYVRAANIDGDSDMDILGGGFTAGVSWWENNDGSGTSWTEHVIDGSFAGAVSVKAEDIDKDGDLDVTGAAMNDDLVTWWENTDGSGTSWTGHLVSGSFDGAYSVDPGDFDGDTEWDVTACAYYGDEVRWWGLSGYAGSAELTSNVLGLAINGIVEWGEITWSCNEPAGTSVAFLVRSSDDFMNMGPWSDTITISGTDLDSILNVDHFFVQYKALLGSTNPANSPVLDDITVSWLPWTGIGDGAGEGVACSIYPCSPNPAVSTTTVGFNLPECGFVTIRIFDLTGRLVSVPVSDEFPAGEHLIPVMIPHPGVYLCRMEAGEYTAVERFVIVGD